MVGLALPRVLVVDDRPEMGRALARVFGGVAEVTVVASGAAALVQIRSEPPFDLVLCDVMMPEMTGPQLYDQVLASDPTTAGAFVFTTGGVAPEQRTHLRATGVPCLIKPIDVARLRALLRCGEAGERVRTGAADLSDKGDVDEG